MFLNLVLGSRWCCSCAYKRRPLNSFCRPGCHGCWEPGQEDSLIIFLGATVLGSWAWHPNQLSHLHLVGQMTKASGFAGFWTGNLFWAQRGGILDLLFGQSHYYELSQAHRPMALRLAKGAQLDEGGEQLLLPSNKQHTQYKPDEAGLSLQPVSQGCSTE